MIRVILIFVVLSAGLSAVVWTQNRGEDQYQELAKKSETVLVGKVEARYPVVRPEKAQGKVVGNTFELPSPNEYQAGTVFKIRIDEVIQGKAKIQTEPEQKDFVYIFVKGYLPAHGDAALTEGKSYVLFLSSLKFGEVSENLEILDATQQQITNKPFNTTAVHIVVKKELLTGAFEVESVNDQLIKKLKQLL